METRHDEETIRWPACRPVPIFLGLAALMDSGTGKIWYSNCFLGGLKTNIHRFNKQPKLYLWKVQNKKKY
jgi:hypothetical protein